jgi:hypothetical protein
MMVLEYIILGIAFIAGAILHYVTRHYGHP